MNKKNNNSNSSNIMRFILENKQKLLDSTTIDLLK